MSSPPSSDRTPPESHDVPWLSIVGIGADGADSLSSAARDAVASGGLVVGSERLLRYVQSLVRGESFVWPHE